MAHNPATGDDGKDTITDEYAGTFSGRRSFLKLLGGVGIAAGLGRSMSTAASAAATDLSSSVIGGGSTYANHHTSGDYAVSTLGALQNALASASSGEVVFVDGSAHIDLGSDRITVPRGVTLASDRGVNGSNGAVIEGYNATPAAIRNFGTIEGLEIVGPVPDFLALDDRYRYGSARGIECYDDSEVANCHVHHYTDGGITVDGAKRVHIHHCEVSDHPVEGVGYGILANPGGGLDDRVVIEYCYMHTCRHEIAAHGSAGYIVRHCVFGEDTFENPTGNLMQQDIDDHGSGAVHEIYNNEFRETGHDAVSWRNDVSSDSEIHHNWFWHGSRDDALDSDVFSSVASSNVYDNHYGPSDPPADVGAGTDASGGDGGDDTDDGQATPDTVEFEVVSDAEYGEVTYAFTADGPVSQAAADIESNDSAVDNGDGTWSATGSTGNGYADVWEVGGDVLEFSTPAKDAVTLILDGTDVTDDLLGSGDGEHRLFEIQTASDSGNVTYEFVADGAVEQTSDDVESNDDASENGDGTWTATGITGNGYADAWEVGGDVLEFTASDENAVTLLLDGTDVTDDLLGSEDAEQRIFEIQTASDSGNVTYEFVADGTVAQVDVESNDDASENGDGTWTATGITGNGYDDAWEVGGDVLEFTASDEDAVTMVLDGTDVTDDLLAGDGGNGGSELPHLITFDGRDASSASTYSFAVTGSIEPEADDSIEDSDVISGNAVEAELAGGDVDRYRFSGSLTTVEVDGSATVDIQRDG